MALISLFCSFVFTIAKKETGFWVFIFSGLVFIISDMSLCSVLTEHRGLWSGVTEVDGNVSSEDSARNQILGSKKVGQTNYSLQVLFPSLGCSLAPLQHQLSPLSR